MTDTLCVLCTIDVYTVCIHAYTVDSVLLYIIEYELYIEYMAEHSLCAYGLTLISCDSMHCWCTPRIRPWAITLLCLHFPTVHHCSVPPGPSAAVRRRYVALSPLNYSNEIKTLQSCLSAIHVWFCENGMASNPTKSDAILFGTSQRLKTMSTP